MDLPTIWVGWVERDIFKPDIFNFGRLGPKNWRKDE